MHKKELADFLRRRRDTLQSGDFGLAPGPRPAHRKLLRLDGR
ncbi:hypothetical protein [Streptomyces sp. 2A115]